MSVQSVEYFAFQQVEDFERGVARCGEQVVPARVKRNGVDGLRVAGVVLDELVGANVPDFDRGVGGAGGDERTARVEGNAVDVARVLVECVDALFGVAVPDFDGLVVRGAHD